jgi:peptidase M48-like protein
MKADSCTRIGLLALVMMALVGAAFGKDVLVLPELRASVVDSDGGGAAAGIGVEVQAQTDKGKEYSSLGEATTDASGSATFPSQAVPDIKSLRVAFSWEDAKGVPRRTIVFQAKIKKGGKTTQGKWARVDKPKAQYVAEGEADGDCSNLFAVESGDGRLHITLRRPKTYLACEDPDFKFPDLAKIGSRKINKGKINFFSFNDDMRLGQNFYNEVGASPENPVLQDQAVASYVQNLIDRIGKASDNPDLHYSVRVIDADVLNAFALPGGYVFVYRGLLEAADTESELVGVLAHEIAHVTSRHGTEGMTSAIAKVLGAILAGEIVASQIKGSNDTVRELVKGLIFTGTEFWILGGSRKREAEADHLGAEYAWNAGYDPRGLATFFEKFTQKRGYKQTRLEQFFSDHPNDEERIREVTRKVDYFLPPREGLIVSSAEFKAMKARLSKLPPPTASGELAANALMGTFKAENEKLILTELKQYLDTEGTEEKKSSENQ